LLALVNILLPLLSNDYYAYLINKQNYEDEIITAYDKAVKSNDLSILIDTLDVDFAQWKLMRRFTSGIEDNTENFIRIGHNKDGSVWTMYDIDDRSLKEYDGAFYRIDKNAGSYYLSLRQYCKYDKPEYMDKVGVNDKDVLYQKKMKRRDLYRKCFEQAVRQIDLTITIKKSDKGAYESEIGCIDLDSIDKIMWLEKNLAIVTNTFLQLVKQSII
jgi:hypothetical protein